MAEQIDNSAKLPAAKLQAAGSLFLIGMPGAGKTTLAKLIADNLHYPWIDADQYLREQTGVDIATIFELEGEDGFRQRESQVIDTLTQWPRIILATGGGVVLNANNRQLLHQRGWVIYLHIQPEALWARLRHDKTRPLLQVNDRLLKLQQLYQQRDPLYRQTAHHIIEIDHKLSPHQITSDILAFFKASL